MPDPALPTAGIGARSDGLVRAATVVLRIVAAGLIATMAGIHLHLWSTGYRHVPTIGDLFVVNAVVGAVLACGLLVVPIRLLGVTAAATTLFVAGTLGALVLSLHVALFGFREFAGAPFLDDSYVVESAGIAAAGALAALSLSRRLRRPTRPTHHAAPMRPLETENQP